MPNSAAAPVSFFGPRGALVIGGSLLFCFLLVLGFGALDHFGSTEQFVERTGLGDPNYFQPPGDPSEAAMVKFEGQALLVGREREYGMRDYRMLRVGVDSQSNLNMYREQEGREGKESKDGPLYVKIGPGRYLKLSSARK